MKWIKNHVYVCGWGSNPKIVFINIFKEYKPSGIIFECIYPEKYKVKNAIVGNRTLEQEINHIVDLGPYTTFKDFQNNYPEYFI